MKKLIFFICCISLGLFYLFDPFLLIDINSDKRLSRDLLKDQATKISREFFKICWKPNANYKELKKELDSDQYRKISKTLDFYRPIGGSSGVQIVISKSRSSPISISCRVSANIAPKDKLADIIESKLEDLNVEFETSYHDENYYYIMQGFRNYVAVGNYSGGVFVEFSKPKK